jgi:hypothetical protein
MSEPTASPQSSGLVQASAVPATAALPTQGAGTVRQGSRVGNVIQTASTQVARMASSVERGARRAGEAVIKAKKKVFSTTKKAQPASPRQRLVVHEESKARLVHGILIGIVVIAVAVIVLIIVGELTKPCDPNEKKKSVACSVADAANQWAQALKELIEMIGHYAWAIIAVAGVYLLTAAAKVFAEFRARTGGGGNEPEPPKPPGPDAPEEPSGPDAPDEPPPMEEESLTERTIVERVKSAHLHSSNLRLLSSGNVACDTWMGL